MPATQRYVTESGTRFGGRAAPEIPMALSKFWPMGLVEDLCHPLAGRRRSVQGDLDDGPRLILPFKRTDTVRVSEQESRVLPGVRAHPWFYSVETPTPEAYSQKGASALSGRIDVMVCGSRSATDRVLNA